MLDCVLQNFANADVANNMDFGYKKEANDCFNVKINKTPLIQNL